MDHIVCLRLGAIAAFSREYWTIVRQVNPGATQGKLPERLGTATVLQAESCEQVTGYLTHAPRPHGRVLAIIGQQPASAQSLSNCFSAGLTDFLLEPLSPAELNARLRRILEGAGVPRPPSDNGSLVGDSATLARLTGRIMQVARTDVPVIVMGETGSGKELVARAIHYESPRAAYAFLPVNCGALPDHLFENEVFGHVRGAYTNAESASKGLVSEAEGGTLFLDEIDALSLEAQVKLLRFLQFGEYRPLGSSRTANADVRCIAATNTDLAKLVKQGLFREDLLHRLNVVSICVPPLRERSGDIPLLTRHFLHKYRQECPFPSPVVSDAALALLKGYSWPGNVRELESVVRRALIFAESQELQASDFPTCDGEPRTPEVAAETSFQEAKTRLVAAFEK
ncbi:MAG: sigma-54 dependent transcriptional regulator, partial [Verrucomicrobia bacterium]|nr:sigma-54 dependent transcriptional regulator [Verrucomicrobiota bacterium]